MKVASGSCVARYYDPRTSVWQKPDPILGGYVDGIAGGVHVSMNLGLYTYGRQNPLYYKDADGNLIFLAAIPWIIKAGGAALALYGSYEAGQTVGTAAVELYKGDKSVGEIAKSAAVELGVNVAMTVTGTKIAKLAPDSIKKKAADLVKKVTGGNVTNSGTTTVGRWMSKAEHKAMTKSGKVQESFSGTTHVADPADASAFLKQAAPGSRYVEFDVPTSALKSTNQGWSKVVGPNSLEGRLATKKGLPVPQMPNATNIIHRADKLR